MEFASLRLRPNACKALAEAGFTEPTPIQEQAIPPLLAGQDVIGIAPTGTGKTAAFLLPVLQHLSHAQAAVPRALVLAPTKELVMQLHREAVRFAAFTDLRVCALYGGVGPKAQEAVLAQGQDLGVATPGRFWELYRREALVVKKIAVVVLDEADRMMDMGFMPQLRQLQEILPRKRQNILFSATFPPRVERLAEEFLLWPVRVEAAPQATAAPNVQQQAAMLPNFPTKLNFVAHLASELEPVQRMLVFVKEKQQADAVAQHLARVFPDGIKTLHSNKAQHSRINAMEAYRSGEVRCLVSTDVSSRGIDVPETEVVVNLTVPRDPLDYVHRIGRTGRAHRTGRAVTLVDPGERYAWERIEAHLGMRPERLALPDSVVFEETSPGEKKDQARAIDFERRRMDPTYTGAVHEKKRKPGAASPARKRRR